MGTYGVVLENGCSRRATWLGCTLYLQVYEETRRMARDVTLISSPSIATGTVADALRAARMRGGLQWSIQAGQTVLGGSVQDGMDPVKQSSQHQNSQAAELAVLESKLEGILIRPCW
jgi:hypothetical protein